MNNAQTFVKGDRVQVQTVTQITNHSALHHDGMLEWCNRVGRVCGMHHTHRVGYVYRVRLDGSLKETFFMPHELCHVHRPDL